MIQVNTPLSMYKKRKEIRQQTDKQTREANHKSCGLSEFKYEKSESGGFLLSLGITLAHAGEATGRASGEM